jgi:hypothetical protein
MVPPTPVDDVARAAALLGHERLAQVDRRGPWRLALVAVAHVAVHLHQARPCSCPGCTTRRASALSSGSSQCATSPWAAAVSIAQPWPPWQDVQPKRSGGWVLRIAGGMRPEGLVSVLEALPRHGLMTGRAAIGALQAGNPDLLQARGHARRLVGAELLGDLRGTRPGTTASRADGRCRRRDGGADQTTPTRARTGRSMTGYGELVRFSMSGSSDASRDVGPRFPRPVEVPVGAAQAMPMKVRTRTTITIRRNTCSAGPIASGTTRPVADAGLRSSHGHAVMSR